MGRAVIEALADIVSAVQDYLAKYITPAGFDVPRLINDDFFEAIRLLFKAGYYVSASKLLFCFIDSISFVESGDSSAQSFQRWLDTYVELDPLGVTPSELWEHRNSLLHSTGLTSRKVAAGHVSRLVAYVGHLPPGAPTRHAEAKWYNLSDLIKAVASGLSRYLDGLNKNPANFERFVERYDQIVSDVRYERIAFNDVG